MAKVVFLKPIVWNEKKYKGPSESLPRYKRFIGRDEGSYPTYHGFGHEEWNNNKRIWRGYQVFHTEKTKRLFDYSSEGELAILMISSNKGSQYAVGIACNVYHNTDEEMKLISKDLNIYDYWKELWKLDKVKCCFNEDKGRFLNEWKQDHEWIAWKCPPEFFYWFKSPILLDPQQIIKGKKRLTTMYGRWQGIRREDALSIINRHIPRDHKIREWLTNGEFDNNILPEELRKKPQKSSKSLQKRYGGYSNRPTDRIYQYWVEGIRTAEPLHARLQAKYVDFLRQEGVKDLTPDQNYIDIQYKKGKDNFFTEIKPTEKVQAKYAIRIAIGQLLEYQFNFNITAKLEIVISSKPDRNEINLLKHLGIYLTYYDDKNNKFIRITP
jgi:hypothetical protein